MFVGPLAQSVEQLTLNQRVGGSSPPRLTISTTIRHGKIRSDCVKQMRTASDWCDRFRAFVDAMKRNSHAGEYIGDNSFHNFALTDQAESWPEFIEWASELNGTWCFRGQREAVWSLSTSLDRSAIRRHSVTYPNGITSTGYFRVNRDVLARKNLAAFQQRAVAYTKHSPPEGDVGSWFALMQHYGTPTRFLDWTSSPFVAAYFAFEHAAQESDKRSAIWAIDLDWLEKRAHELLPAEMLASVGSTPEARARWESRLLEECREAVIVKMNPLQMNARMAAQQGVLLCKLFHEAYFSSTLMTMMIHPEVPDQPVLRKLEVHTRFRTDFLSRLRKMNVHGASLFPDGATAQVAH